MAEFKGELFGLRIDPPLDGQPGNQVTLLMEDDGNWFEVTSFDAAWLEDLIAIAKAAKAQADTAVFAGETLK